MATTMSFGSTWYDSFVKDYPLTDVSLWKSIYNLFGAKIFIERLEVSDIEFIKSKVEFPSFVAVIRHEIAISTGLNKALPIDLIIKTVICHLRDKYSKLITGNITSTDDFCSLIEKIIKCHLDLEDDLNGSNSKTVHLAKPINYSTMKKSAFVIHGWDDQLCKELQLILANKGWRPIPLGDQPNLGRGLWKKFEEELRASDIVVVIMSGDHYGKMERLAKDESGGNFIDNFSVCRPNVLIELGFALKAKGDENKMILLVDKRKNRAVEIPSDIAYLTYIPIEDNLQVTFRKFEQELTEFSKIN
jgi:predicted nucleotide-binding protein